MKKYLISMYLDGKYSYVAALSDYDHGGFVDIDLNDFAFDSYEEAKNIKNDITNYARGAGDINTEFFIEKFEIVKISK